MKSNRVYFKCRINFQKCNWKKYNGYLRDVQSEVLDKWFDQRNNKDNISFI